MNNLTESEVQNLVYCNDDVKNGILSALNLSDQKVVFIKEDEYINGIIADFTLILSNEIVGIMECKSGNINVTDYVRGIGQLLQYEFFSENQVYHKSFKYNPEIKTIFLFPSSVIKNNCFNMAKFKYPKSTIILELNEVNKAVRKIDNSELKKLSNVDSGLITISQYYFRDNRVFEYYILLKYLLLLNQMGISSCDRKKAEENLKKVNTINNRNWRNAFITLSNLGLINHDNMLTAAGKKLSILDFDMFAINIFHSYIKVYFYEILKVFENKQRLNIKNIDIVERIKSNYRNKNIMYLTQSNARYISSWLNIMRDDYGIIKFEKCKSKRIIVYDPFELNDKAFSEYIKKNTKAYDYIIRFEKLVKEGDIK